MVNFCFPLCCNYSIIFSEVLPELFKHELWWNKQGKKQGIRKASPKQVSEKHVKKSHHRQVHAQQQSHRKAYIVLVRWSFSCSPSGRTLYSGPSGFHHMIFSVRHFIHCFHNVFIPWGVWQPLLVHLRMLQHPLFNKGFTLQPCYEAKHSAPELKSSIIPCKLKL